MMLDRKARHETEPLRRDVEVEIIAEALSGLGTKIAAICLRRREQSEFHEAYSLLEPRNSKPRQIGKRDTSRMHMHAPKLGAAVQRRKHLAGIKQALVVEG